MIKVIIPDNNIFERKYILDIILYEFLGMEYELLEDSTCNNWKFKLKNNATLTFEDHFFFRFLNDLEYLDVDNIPLQVTYSKNEFTSENDIPVIFGNSKCKVEKQTIVCGIDIFASCFFMLTRWEEYVNKTRDDHNRFLSTESLAFKNGFLDRPVVNEYIEMLKNMLLELDDSLIFKKREYQLYLTHDVDMPLKYTSFTSGIKEIVGDFIKRKDISLAFKNISLKIKTLLKINKDPFDTFDYLMNISDKVGVKSYFFFMGKGLTQFDNFYKSSDSFINELITKIKSRGHHIGIHPTYNAYNDKQQFANEKKELEQNLDTKIVFGREHYLRFEVPTTWQTWEDNGMQWDSTLSYADKEGFRCGVCYEYSVFNVLTRQKLKLKEKPLIVMDGSFITYQPNISAEEMENKIKELIQKVKKYNGEFVYLWHNSSFNVSQWKNYQAIYERVLQL